MTGGLRVTTLVMAAVALLTGAVSGCTAPDDLDDAPRPRYATETPPQHVGLTCEHLTKKSVLGEYVANGQLKGDDPGHGDEYYDNHERKTGSDLEGCHLWRHVRDPVEGRLMIHLNVEIPHRHWDPDEVEKFRSEGRAEFSHNGERLSDCVRPAECWIRTEDCRDPAASSDRTLAAYGISELYRVRVVVGLWPDDRQQLCEADEWSATQATTLLRDALAYLTSR